MIQARSTRPSRKASEENMHRLPLVGAIVAVVLLSGCRGTENDHPPIHLNLNMDFQERFDPQERNVFFEDGRAMRPTVPGTIPRGFLREDRAFYEGRTAGDAFVVENPLPMSEEVLARGQERYQIYCTPCHGAAGDGRGIVSTGGYGLTPAPSYHTDFMRALPDGHLYDVITNGIRTMPPYASQVSVADRWAIVAYVRALQRSQNASLEDVPASMRAQMQTAVSSTPQDTTAAPEAGAQ